MTARDSLDAALQSWAASARPLLPSVGETALLRIRENIGHAEGCWPWQGSINRQGYGVIAIEGREFKAHRLVYQLEVGDIPRGLTLDHTCHNSDLTCRGGAGCPHRRCVNPAHLEPVTVAVNTLRSTVTIAGINARKAECKRGHEFTPDNIIRTSSGHRRCRSCDYDRRAKYLRSDRPRGYAYLRDEDLAARVQTLYEAGFSQREVGEHLGICSRTVVVIMREFGIPPRPIGNKKPANWTGPPALACAAAHPLDPSTLCRRLINHDPPHCADGTDPWAETEETDR